MSGQSRSLPFLQRGLEHSKYSDTSNPNSRYGGRSWIALFVDDTRTRMSAILGKALKKKFIFVDDMLTGSSTIRQSKTILAQFHRRPNVSTSEIRSKPRLSLRGRT